MHDENGTREAFAISWSEPDFENAQPAWAGPAPDAVREAPQQPAQSQPHAGSMSQAWASWTSAAPVASPPSTEPAAPTRTESGVLAETPEPQTSAHDEPAGPVDAPVAHPVMPEGEESAASESSPAPAGISPDESLSEASSDIEHSAASNTGAPETAAEPAATAQRTGSTPVGVSAVPNESGFSAHAETDQPHVVDDSHSHSPEAAHDDAVGPVVAAPAVVEPTNPGPAQHPVSQGVPATESTPSASASFEDEGHGYDQSFMDAPSEEEDASEVGEHGDENRFTPAPVRESAPAPEPSGQVDEPAPALHESATPAENAAAAHEPASAQPVEEPSFASTPPQVVGQNDEIPEDALTIGRSRTNVIVLDDMLVSRQHVVITADEEGLLLRDLGSRNGTYVNGERIEQRHLNEGDRISIGASTFEVRDGWLVSV